MILRAAAKNNKPNLLPSEVYPIIVCMGFVGVFASYRLTKNYMNEHVRSGHQGNDTARLPKEH